MTQRQQAVLKEVAVLAGIMCPRRKYPHEVEAYNSIMAALRKKDCRAALSALRAAEAKRCSSEPWRTHVIDRLAWAEEVLSTDVQAQAVAA